MKKIWNKIKKYLIIIGSILLSITIFILSFVGFKTLTKNKLSKKEKDLKDKYNNLKKEKEEVIDDIEKIKNNIDTIDNNFYNSPFNKSRDK